MEQHVRPRARGERTDDSLERSALRTAQLGGLGLAGQHVAIGGTRALPARLSLQRRDERERPARRRPVVRGHPERELDECRRQLLHDALDGRGGDPFRRSDADLRDDAAPPRVSEPDLHDGAGPDALRHLVGELARESASGDERIDGREGHAASVVPTKVGGWRTSTGIPPPTSS